MDAPQRRVAAGLDGPHVDHRVAAACVDLLVEVYGTAVVDRKRLQTGVEHGERALNALHGREAAKRLAERESIAAVVLPA